MDVVLVCAALPLMVAFVAGLLRLNGERDRGTPWGDAILRAFTRSIYVFVMACLVEVALAALATGVAYLAKDGHI